jgi:hypothetical protein
LRKAASDPLLVAADFSKEFFDLCFIESVSFGDFLSDSSLAVSCWLQSKMMLVI